MSTKVFAVAKDRSAGYEIVTVHRDSDVAWIVEVLEAVIGEVDVAPSWDDGGNLVSFDKGTPERFPHEQNFPVSETATSVAAGTVIPPELCGEGGCTFLPGHVAHYQTGGKHSWETP